MDILDDMGVSKSSAIFLKKVNCLTEDILKSSLPSFTLCKKFFWINHWSYNKRSMN